MDMEIMYPHYGYSPIDRTTISDTICEWITREAINKAYKSRMKPSSSIDEDGQLNHNYFMDKVITGQAYIFIFRKPYGDTHYNVQHDDDLTNRDMMVKLSTMNRYLVRGKVYALNPAFDIRDVMPTLDKLLQQTDFMAEIIEEPASSFSTAEIHRMISLSQVFPFVFNASPQKYWYAKYSS